MKLGGGNRYGLIGANGCGKSTFVKILGGELEPGAGTLVFVSHDRELISSLATRVIELEPGGEVIDYRGGYEEYLAGERAALAAA